MSSSSASSSTAVDPWQFALCEIFRHRFSCCSVRRWPRLLSRRGGFVTLEVMRRGGDAVVVAANVSGSLAGLWR
ncbi:hypothetical protein P8452_09211 [Trifolium repens]|nr:hypothetical protein P8452_09211 [Trifolium repens]